MTKEARVESYATMPDSERPSPLLESENISVHLESRVLDSQTFAIGPILAGNDSNVDAVDNGSRSTELATQEPIGEGRSIAPESPDSLATRACIAATLGLVTLPVLAHAYSIWMLLRITPTALTPAVHYRYTLAWVCNSLVFSALLAWLAIHFY